MNCTGADVETWGWFTAYTSPSPQTLSAFPYYQLVHLTTATTGQYVRMKPKTLGGAYPASIYEFEVYSAP